MGYVYGMGIKNAEVDTDFEFIEKVAKNLGKKLLNFFWKFIPKEKDSDARNSRIFRYIPRK